MVKYLKKFLLFRTILHLLLCIYICLCPSNEESIIHNLGIPNKNLLYKMLEIDANSQRRPSRKLCDLLNSLPLSKIIG